MSYGLAHGSAANAICLCIFYQLIYLAAAVAVLLAELIFQAPAGCDRVPAKVKLWTSSLPEGS